MLRITILYFLFFMLCSFSLFAQRIPDKVIDTFQIRTGKIVLYENNKWLYLEEISDTVKPTNDKFYFDSEMLINQGKTPYQKTSEKNSKKKKVKAEGLVGSNAAYSIKKGDNLMSIAKKHGTTVDKLCSLNNISKTSKLKIGQKIKVK